ncbi:hypothetical protein F2Q69_00022712 [Brassica cretica]|uniref:Uncharacterized protein n=1 Tax=Brassica cretica TaxID=69181 RepID=A0A8S9PZI9_BRACR|nr:hypothetical protein F2Q69_00022712 [Brassica cretica]
MQRISSTVPRSHILWSIAASGKFNFYGIIDFPELMDLLDMFRLENRLEMRTKFFNCHKYPGPMGNLGFPNFPNLNGNRQCEFRFPQFGAKRRGDGSLSATNARSDMSTDELNNLQTRDGYAVDDNAVDDNAENTPAANVTAVNFNIAALEKVQKMFSTFEKKSEERDKVMRSSINSVKVSVHWRIIDQDWTDFHESSFNGFSSQILSTSF